MDTHEEYYLCAQNGDKRAYYRMRITGKSRLGVAEFRQGWFPADAVDALFGDVSKEGSARALNVQEELRQQIDSALIKAQKEYLECVLAGDSREKKTASLEKIRDVRLSLDNAIPPGTDRVDVMEYSPRESLVTRRSGQKLVMMVSSNPDEIIGRISRFTNDEKTQQEILKFTEVVAAKQRGSKVDSAAAAGAFDAYRGVLVEQLKSVSGRLATTQPVVTREQALADIDGLLTTAQATTSSK